ncbi:MAG: hypothetical protein K2M89_06255 [Clostridiales bacterium]|nr:hypothetical protein [Clostridiales bacterium]
MTESIKCPYCGTTTTLHKHTKRRACACRRLHEYIDVNGKKYNVLYKKGGTKEIIR